ncbi:hypothetical protein JCM1393_06370 [Clostridium carnis]
MRVEICKWKNNSNSPVIFMIDDLANSWVDVNKDSKVNLSEDWGFWRESENSSIRYLEENILSVNDEIKVTFFVPVGERVGIIKNSDIPMYSYPINHDEESKKFFKKLHFNKRYELAYHGITHGEVSDIGQNFKQEWQLYTSYNEACDKVRQGMDIFKDAVTVYPLGGKYCGYQSNEFSDNSIDKNEFLWWCRYCNMETEKSDKSKPNSKWLYGEDYNFISNMDIKYFGENKVIDIPTTLNGGIFTSILNSNTFTFKALIKKILKKIILKKKLDTIDRLINNNLVISIQEHISPARNDGKIQYPNIFTDSKSLKYIFEYLKKKNVWYCTGTELASYVYYRDNLKIKIEEDKIFINLDNEKNICYKEITLKISEGNALIDESGKRYKIIDGIVTIDLNYNTYKVV